MRSVNAVPSRCRLCEIFHTSTVFLTKYSVADIEKVSRHLSLHPIHLKPDTNGNLPPSALVPFCSYQEDPFISWIPYKIRAYSHSNHRALQSKSTTVGDYRRGPEPDRQKARCRAGTVPRSRGRGTSSATEQVSADENLRRFIPSKNPLPSRSSLP